jgi:hypothetical protein
MTTCFCFVRALSEWFATVKSAKARTQMQQGLEEKAAVLVKKQQFFSEKQQFFFKKAAVLQQFFKKTAVFLKAQSPQGF